MRSNDVTVRVLTGKGSAEHKLAIRASDGEDLTTYKLTSNAQWHRVAILACFSIRPSVIPRYSRLLEST